MQFFEKLNELGKKGGGKLFRNLIILGLLGILLLMAGNIFTNTDSKKIKPEKKEIKTTIENNNSYVSNLSSNLEETLSMIEGAGKVKVQLLVEKGVTYEYEYNKDKTNKITNETDRNGGERKIKEDNLENELVVIEDASGNEKPIVRVKKKPEITGAIIVAQGAKISKLKYEIYKTVSKFLDLPLHKINVLPYKGR